MWSKYYAFFFSRTLAIAILKRFVSNTINWTQLLQDNTEAIQTIYYYKFQFSIIQTGFFLCRSYNSRKILKRTQTKMCQLREIPHPRYASLAVSLAWLSLLFLRKLQTHYNNVKHYQLLHRNQVFLIIQIKYFKFILTCIKLNQTKDQRELKMKL